MEPFFTQDLYNWEVSLVGNLMNDLHMVYISNSDRDSRIWFPSLDGLFSSKSLLSVLSRESPSLFPFHEIWSSAAPPRVRLSIRDIPQRRRPFIALSPLICCRSGVSREWGK